MKHIFLINKIFYMIELSYQKIDILIKIDILQTENLIDMKSEVIGEKTE